MRKLFLLFVFLLFSCTGFADSKQKQTTASPATAEIQTQTVMPQAWTISRFEREFGGSDPLLGWNTAMFTFNDFLIRYVARPIGIGYTTILPRPIIEVISNFCNNLTYPRKLITCLGTAEWGGAWDETLRFFTNTTLGLGGMFDPAKHWFHIYSTQSDFARMFAVWGIDPGCTLILPFCSFINVRDGFGSIFDQLFDGKTYIPYASTFVGINQIILAEAHYNAYMQNAADRYHLYRVFAIARRKMINEMKGYHAANAFVKKLKSPPPVIPPLPEDKTIPPYVIPLKNYYPQGSLIDTFRVMYFQPEKRSDYWWMRLSYFNRDFDKNCEERKIRVNGNDPYEYLYRAPDPDGVQRKKPGLVFILPGIGTRKEGSSPITLAEMFWNKGFHVAVLDSAFVTDFSERVCNNNFPGNAKEDVKHIQHLLCSIVMDLKQNAALPADTEISVMGWSFGGIHTLFLADLEQRKPQLNAVRYLAVAPPVDLGYAIKQVDSFAKVSIPWNKEEAKKHVLHTFTSLMGINSAVVMLPEGSVFNRLDLTEEQAKFIIASNFRLTIRNLLLKKHMTKALSGIKNNIESENRVHLLEELDNFPFRQYTSFFPVAYEQLVKDTSLRSIEQTLRNNKKIRVIHTWDDFLLDGPDKEYLTKTLGNRITWYRNGGHLGNLYTKQVKDKIREWIEK